MSNLGEIGTLIRDFKQKEKEPLSHTVLPSEPVTIMMATYHEQRRELLSNVRSKWTDWKKTAPLGVLQTKSVYSMVMAPRENQKANESIYRELIINGDGIDGYPQEFLDLVSQKFKKRGMPIQNPEEYNAVIDKAEIFHNLEHQKDQHTSELVDAAIRLCFACDEFLNLYTDKAYSDAIKRVRVERAYIIDLLLNDDALYDNIKSKNLGTDSLRKLICHEGSLKTEKARERVSEVTASYVMEETDHEKQIDRLRDTIICFIDSWLPHEDYGRQYPKQEGLVNSIKHQLKTELNLDKMKRMIIPSKDYKPLLCSARDAQTEKEYINEEMVKMLIKYSNEQMKAHMIGFTKGLDQMMGDILFWGLNRGKDSVETIRVTGSDLHDRGLGVCLINYVPKEFFALKPDERRFEYRLLRNTQKKGEKSLIEKYNERTQEQLMTLKMYMVGFDGIAARESHGTLIEGVEDLRQISRVCWDDKVVEKTVSIDKKRNMSAAWISTLLGIGDLHPENVFYVKRQDEILYNTLLGDADVLDYSVLGNLEGVMNLGGFLPSVESEDKNPVKYFNIQTLQQFVSSCAELMLTEERRITPLDTYEYGRIMDEYTKLEGEGESQALSELYNNLKEETYSSIKTIFSITTDAGLVISMQNRLDLINYAIMDFKRGAIPLYKFNPQTGEIITHERPICKIANYTKPFSEKKEIVLTKVRKEMISKLLEAYKININVSQEEKKQEEAKEDVISQIINVKTEEEFTRLNLKNVLVYQGTDMPIDNVLEQIKSLAFLCRP